MSKSAIDHLRGDAIMARLIDRVGPVKLRPRRLPPFQSLAHAVVHQQLHGKAAATILGRFRALFTDTGFPSPEAVLKVSLENLRSAGLSRAKASYILGIAQKAMDGHIPSLGDCEKMPDDEIVARLTEINGVGRWTAEMFLMFNLGRPDILPIHDFGVRKGFQIAYKKRKLPKPEQLEKFGKKWSPHRTTAALYMYRAADFLKDGEW